MLEKKSKDVNKLKIMLTNKLATFKRIYNKTKKIYNESNTKILLK